MGIQLKLDTNALASLIEADPEFKLQLRQAILQNIADRYIKTTDADIQRELTVAAASTKQQILDMYTVTVQKDRWSSTRTLNEDLKKEIAKVCRTHIESSIGSLIRDEISKWIEASAEDNRRRIHSMMEVFTTSHIKEMLKTRFEKAIKALNE